MIRLRSILARRTCLSGMILAVIAMVVISACLFWPLFRDHTIRTALAGAIGPSPWWPATWCDEYQTIRLLTENQRSMSRTRWVAETRYRALRPIRDRSTMVATLIKVRKDDDMMPLHQEAELAIEWLNVDDRAAIPVLARALRDADPHIRQLAVHALGRIGLPARKAEAQIRRLLDDPDPAVRIDAAETLRGITDQADAWAFQK